MLSQLRFPSSLRSRSMLVRASRSINTNNPVLGLYIRYQDSYAGASMRDGLGVAGIDRVSRRRYRGVVGIHCVHSTTPTHRNRLARCPVVDSDGTRRWPPFQRVSGPGDAPKRQLLKRPIIVIAYPFFRNYTD